MTGAGRVLKPENFYPGLAELVQRLDRRKIADMPWVGGALINGLLENV